MKIYQCDIFQDSQGFWLYTQNPRRIPVLSLFLLQKSAKASTISMVSSEMCLAVFRRKVTFFSSYQKRHILPTNIDEIVCCQGQPLQQQLFNSAISSTSNSNSNSKQHTTNNNKTIWRGSVLTGEEPPPHSGELKHALPPKQVAQPNPSCPAPCGRDTTSPRSTDYGGNIVKRKGKRKTEKWIIKIFLRRTKKKEKTWEK